MAAAIVPNVTHRGVQLDHSEDRSTDNAPPARLRRLNSNLLYALYAVLRSSSLTAAARSVALSQPAMSSKLRQLREHFGDELVLYGDRRGLTALGEALLPRVGRVLREVDDTFNLVLDFDPATTRQTVSVTAPEAIELAFLGRIMPELRAAAPGIEIRMVPFVHGSTRRLFDAGADIAIVPEAMVDDSLCSLPLTRHSLTGLIRCGHPLEGLRLSEEVYLAARHAAVFPEIEKAMFGDYGLGHLLARRDVAVRTALHSMLPQLIVNSDLVATTSNWFAQYCAAALPVTLVTLDFAMPSSKLVAQWQPYRAREPLIRWLLEQLTRGIAGIGAAPSKSLMRP